MRFTKLTLLGISVLLVFLLGCSERKPIETKTPIDADETTNVEAVVASREAVFTYGPKHNRAKKIKLSVGGEPTLLPSGYVRLGGVVSGERPIACLEVGGKGLALMEGEKIDDYRVVRINGGQVVLERR